MLGGERTRKDAVYQADGKGKIERQMILSPFADIDRNFTTLTRSINRWFFCASFEFLVCTYEFSCILTDLKRSLPFFPYIVSFFSLFSLVFTPCRISLCFLLPPLTFLYFFFFFILPFGTHSRLSIFLFLFSISSVLPFLQCFILHLEIRLCASYSLPCKFFDFWTSKKKREFVRDEEEEEEGFWNVVVHHLIIIGKQLHPPLRVTIVHSYFLHPPSTSSISNFLALIRPTLFPPLPPFINLLFLSNSLAPYFFSRIGIKLSRAFLASGNLRWKLTTISLQILKQINRAYNSLLLNYFQERLLWILFSKYVTVLYTRYRNTPKNLVIPDSNPSVYFPSLCSSQSPSSLSAGPWNWSLEGGNEVCHGSAWPMPARTAGQRNFCVI